MAATSVGRARRAFDYALSYAAERKQFGKPIGANQGVSFKLADMITEIDAADLLTLSAAWRLDQGLPSNREIASAKVFATEMLARVPTRRSRSMAAWGSWTTCRSPASGATPASSASGMGPRRSSVTSSAAICSGRWGLE